MRKLMRQHWSLLIPFLGLLLIPVRTQTAVTTPSPYESPAYRQAFFNAARIYGKAGCGDIRLAELTAEYSVRNQVPANQIAAIVSVESTCNPLAVSPVGDVGLLQINVGIQAKSFDFSRVNLFNPEQNMDTGTKIMATLIRTYGPKWVSHYNGSGVRAEAYAVKVLALAGK